MSTDYILEKSVLMNELFDGRLEQFGIFESLVEGGRPEDLRIFEEGTNHVLVNGNDRVNLITTSFARGSSGKILAAIALAFDTNIWSEHEPQFWGFETDDKWEYSRDHFGRGGREELYTEIMRFVRGQPNHIDLGVIGMRQAILARNLIAENPGLSSPDHEASLMQMIDREYMETDFDYFQIISEDEIMIAKVVATMNDSHPRT